MVHRLAQTAMNDPETEQLADEYFAACQKYVNHLDRRGIRVELMITERVLAPGDKGHPKATYKFHTEGHA